MDNTTQGATQPAAETVTGQPAQTQQTQATQAAETAATTQQAQTSPSVEELQRQLTERDEKLRLATESVRHFQSVADRERQRVQALAGTQTQVDPVDAKVKALVSQGYHEGDARMLVGLIQSETAPLVQQLQQAQQTLQATSITNQVLNAAASDKDYSALFADQEIAMQVDQKLRRIALIPGQRELVNPEYAKAFAESVWVSKNKPWNQQTQQVQTQQVSTQRPFLGFNGPQANGYTPMGQQQQKAANPIVDALAQKMAEHAGHKLNP